MEGQTETAKTVESPVVQESEATAKPVKVKKPRSEAQKAATQKALAAMTAKRKEMNEEIKVKKEKAKVAKKIVEEKILKEDLGFVTLKEYESTKRELAELRGMLTAKQQFEKQVPVSSKPERIVERVIERVPTPIQNQQKLSGYELLDKVFFNK